MRIGSSTYSFKRLGYGTPEEQERTLLDIIEEAPRYDLAGLEVLAVQLASTDKSYLSEIKQRAVANGLHLYAFSLHHNFVKPDKEARRQEEEKVLDLLKIAEFLGIPLVRVFGGRWGTITDFRQLMAREGREDPLPGHEYEEAIAWNIESFRRITDYAAERGITLALENHWGLTYSAEGVLQILEGVASPWFKVALDCGNFRENTYEQLSALAPYTVLVHAKSYQGGGIFYDLDIDYGRVLRILKDVDFNGYISLEYEGKAAPSLAIPAQIQILRDAIARS